MHIMFGQNTSQSPGATRVIQSKLKFVLILVQDKNVKQQEEWQQLINLQEDFYIWACSQNSLSDWSFVWVFLVWYDNEYEWFTKIHDTVVPPNSQLIGSKKTGN